MELELRRIGADEVAAFAASAAVPFFEVGKDDLARHWSSHLEPERAWVIVDEGRFVANACIFTRDMTVPGAPGAPCPTVPVAAVSGVGVHPSHRRRGLLRRLMSVMLADAVERGEPFAALIASESRIYGRFGFGHATSVAQWSADVREVEFAAAPPRLDLRLLERDEATKVLPDLFDHLRRGRAGQVSRNPATWEDVFADLASQREGGSANYYLASESGFAIYRVHEDRSGRWERNRAAVRHLIGATPEVEAAMWRFIFELDLIREVTGRMRPVDEALRWRLTDPRQLRITDVGDVLWVCPLDVPTALTARRYLSDGRLVIDVAAPADSTRRSGSPDPTDAAVGRWVLDAGPDGGTCRRAKKNEPTDLQMGLADLGALYLGGVTASVLSAASRVVEGRPGALVEMDRLMAGRYLPFSSTTF